MIVKIMLDVNKVQLSGEKKPPSSIFFDLRFLRQTHKDGVPTCLLNRWSEQCSKHGAVVSMQIPHGCWLHPLFLTPAATGRKDRRCKWPAQTARFVPSTALWEVWEEDLLC